MKIRKAKENAVNSDAESALSMNEKLSAWMDGELSAKEARPFPLRLKRDTKSRKDWDDYHLIGDALRGIHGPDLCDKIRARLEAEPTVLAPQRSRKRENKAAPLTAEGAYGNTK